MIGRLAFASVCIARVGGLLVVATPVMVTIVWAVWSRQLVVEALRGKGEAEW